MEFVNFEELIKAKVAECDEWLVGEEKAREDLSKAEDELKAAYLAVEEARVAVAEYNEDNIARVKEYRKELRDHLGIVDEPEVVVEEVVEGVLPSTDEHEDAYQVETVLL